MDFMIHGKATPRSGHRHLPGGVHVQGAHTSRINPITGEEMHIATPRQVLGQVPLLNLNYLKEDDKPGPGHCDPRSYSLDTPGSASTVSWGSARSQRMSGRPAQKMQGPVASSSRGPARPEGVPGLVLRDSSQTDLTQAKVQQHSYWDKNPVPADLPQPSARYQQMYQQYSEDMKQSYRKHVNSLDNSKSKQDKSQPDIKQQDKQEHEDLDKDQPDTDMVRDSWTQQRYSHKELLKKKDSEDLQENNKKQKLIEMVMIDQLSRAVISDPEQNQLSTHRQATSLRSRGTNRRLHDSKVSTRTTATESLLSRRLRFEARILTENGHDALRELTGFFFDFDKTLTIYEFRQFGKSAKATPFVYRGQYLHTSGPKQGLPYDLTDIYTGADIIIPTEGQLALTDSLTRLSHMTLRITDVDEFERQALLNDQNGGSYNQSDDDRLDSEDKIYLHKIQEKVHKQISKRGIKTTVGLGRFYRKLDQYKTGILDQFDLELGLKSFNIKLEMEELEQLFEVLDPGGCKLLNYKVYMRGVLGEMCETRKALVRKAFLKLDSSKSGSIHVSDIKKFFNVNSKYKPASVTDTNVTALQAFLDALLENPKQEHIIYLEFEEYYEGLSLSVDSDESFANILRNTWNI